MLYCPVADHDFFITDTLIWCNLYVFLSFIFDFWSWSSSQMKLSTKQLVLNGLWKIASCIAFRLACQIAHRLTHTRVNWLRGKESMIENNQFHASISCTSHIRHEAMNVYRRCWLVKRVADGECPPSAMIASPGTTKTSSAWQEPEYATS